MVHEVSCIVAVTDNKKLEAVKVYLDDEVILAGNGSFTFTRGKASVAKIKVYAVDSEGNMATETAECIFVDNSDKTVPVAEITSPAHASEIFGKVNIEGTAKDKEGLLRYVLQYRIQGSDEFITFSEKTEAVENGVLGTLNTENLRNGVYDIRLTVEDNGGNYEYVQYSYIVNNENEGTGVIPSEEDDKDIIDPVIKLALSKNVASIDENVKVYITVTDNKKVESVQVFVDGVEIEFSGNQTEFTSDKVGKITVKVVATDSSGNTSEKSAICSFYNFSDSIPPELDIISPEYDATLDKPTEIIGSVYDETKLAYYSVEYRPKGAEEYILLKKSSEEKRNESLAVFDTTVLANGIYEFKITAEDFGGNITYCEGQYVVDGTFKVGNTNLSFEDVNTKISGVDISVARYYSSSNKLSGDFGAGWTMSLGGIQLYEMHEMNTGWFMEKHGKELGTVYTLTESASHDVVITYGDGTSERFKAKLNPDRYRFVPLQNTSMEFESPDGSKNKLEAYCDNKIFLWGYLGKNELLDFNTNPFQIDKYKLILEDETIVIIDKKSGVESITDKAGNVINISEKGYVDENGSGLTFTRDSCGRITSITESDGKVTTYTYDDNNDLIKVTNPMGYSVGYIYDDNHNIISIIDSRGVEAAHNEYDDNGRVIATVDANGNRMTYEHDVDGRTDIITDKLGNKSVYVYDDKGNVLKCTDANGNTTYAEYDEYGHITQSTDALGNITHYRMTATGDVLSMTNAIGNTVENSYNDQKQLTSITAMGATQMIVNYDEDGLLTSTEDAMGNSTYYEYDSSYRVKGIADDIGCYISFTYDGKGNVISSVNGAGESATFTYDESGNCTSKTVVKITDDGFENITENYEYDVMDRLIKIIYADGSVTSVEYDGNGNMTAAVDEKGRRISYEYDNNCNLIKVIYCDNTSETFEYDAEGRNTKSTDRMGRTVTMTYDKVGNMLTKIYPNGAEESYTYDAKYRLVSTTGVNGGVTKYEYDEIDRNTAIVDALGNRTEFAYDENSMLSFMTDPKGNVFKYSYDANGNRTKVTMPDGTTISSAYDARGRITTQTDQNGHATSYEYDDADRLISVTDALGSKWEYTYSNVGELASVKDANGNVTSYEYDSMGRVIKTTNAAGKSAFCTYDKSGSILTSTDYAGITTTYTYDSLDRVIRQDVGGDVTEFTYTIGGLLSSVSDKSGVIYYTYDDMDGLTKVKLANGTEIKYSYDDSYRLTRLSTAYGDTSYSYDLMDRLIRVVDRNGVATLYEYDDNSNRTAVKYANGITTTYVYNDVNQLISEESIDKDCNVVVKYVYTLGKAGERLKVTEPDSVTEYTYDELYRLTGEKVTKNGNVTETTYTYDKVGNRLTKIENGTVTEYSYNNLNQLVSETGVTYSYDDNGNLIKKAESGKTTTYTFDNQNRLIRATISNGQDVTVEEYKYDYAGNRTAKITEGVTTNYVVDTNGTLSQVLYETDGTGSLTTFYTRGSELISLQRADEERYYLYDGHGNVRFLTDENGTVTDTYDYDAFGNLTEQTGDTENSYLYCGEQYDANTGFYYLRARYMNPTTGTFISMDSYQGSMFDPVSLHKYLYANSNPIKYNDPTGNCVAVIGGVFGSYELEKAEANHNAWVMQVLRSMMSKIRYEIIGSVTQEMATVAKIVATASVFGVMTSDEAVDAVKEAIISFYNNLQNGWIVYGPLDSYGRATGAVGSITRTMIWTGTATSTKVNPEDYESGQGLARGHLIAKSLGGSGTDKRNLVTIYQNPVNCPIMSGYENTIKLVVLAGQSVYMKVKPFYVDDNGMPLFLTMHAIGNFGFFLNVMIPNVK